MQDVRFRGGGERREIREAAQPLYIIREHSRDLRLLQHDFGNENGVGICRSPPWEIAAEFSEPSQEGTAEGGGVLRGEGGDAGKSNSRRIPSNHSG